MNPKEVEYRSESCAGRQYVRAIHTETGIEGEGTDFSSYHKAKSRALTDLIRKVEAATPAAGRASTA